MRVYEFSKKCNVQSKELLAILRDAGFNVRSHMSVLSDDMLVFLQKKYSPEKVQKASAKKIEKPKQEAQKKAKKPLKESKEEEPVVQTTQQKIKNKPKKESVLQEERVAPALFILEAMTPATFAQKTDNPINEIILTLLKWGILSNKNQLLPEEIIDRLAQHYQIEVVQPEQKKEEVRRAVAVQQVGLKERLPVIAVLGHVDHGKTTLLDFIRKTRIAAREKGGITQHIGAYEAKTSHGNIIFLDTPGHEAFSKIRARGVKVADVVVLVIAADDSIMPQTIEAIKHAKAIEVPIIVAINKIDKVETSQIEAVKRDLMQHDLLPEEWGGKIICVPISAKLGSGIEQLLEMIVLQTQLMELKASPAEHARGYVLESKLEKGRGPVATFLGQQGTLKIGDYFICGATWGRVSSLVDSYGKRVKQAGPSIPVLVAGFETLPEAGDYFEVIPKDELRKARAKIQRPVSVPRRLIEKKAVNIIIKTDSKSSKEALVESIEKLSKKIKPGFAIISASVGEVNESDVVLASDTNSSIFTLHVKTEPNAVNMAQRLSIPIDSFDIIYRLLEKLEEVAQNAKEVKLIRVKTGEATVRKVFDIKKVGIVAGCYVKDGVFSRAGFAEIWRDKKKIGEGKILSLQRDRKPVKEVHAGYECGFLVEGYSDWAVDDRVDCYVQKPEGR